MARRRAYARSRHAWRPVVHVRELHQRGTRVGSAEATGLDRGNRPRVVRRARAGSGGLMAPLLLTAAQAAVVASALAEAEQYRRDTARTWCMACAAAPDGACPAHLGFVGYAET